MQVNSDHPRCIGNIKNCEVKGGGCGYRYKKTDVRWQDGGVCPICGRDRRCHKNVQPRLNGNFNVCYSHGAGSKRTGRTGGRPRKDGSAVFPARMLDLAQQRARDPQLLEMRVEIGMLKEMLEEIAAKLELGESARAWKELGKELPRLREEFRTTWRGYVRSRDTADLPGMKDALNLMDELITGSTFDNLLDLIRGGRNASAAREEIQVIGESIRKISDSQRRWELDKRYYITVTEALALPLAIHRLVQERVEDADLRRSLMIGLELEVINFSKARPNVIEAVALEGK